MYIHYVRLCSRSSERCLLPKLASTKPLRRPPRSTVPKSAHGTSPAMKLWNWDTTKRSAQQTQQTASKLLRSQKTSKAHSYGLWCARFFHSLLRHSGLRIVPHNRQHVSTSPCLPLAKAPKSIPYKDLWRDIPQQYIQKDQPSTTIFKPMVWKNTSTVML